MDNNANQAMNQGARLKTYDELDDAKKIAWLKSQIDSLARSNNYLQQRVNMLERHTHNPAGGVSIPIEMAGNTWGQAAGQSIGGYEY